MVRSKIRTVSIMHLEGITELAELVTSRLIGFKFIEFLYDSYQNRQNTILNIWNPIKGKDICAFN